MGEKKKKGSISYAKWGYIFIAPFFIIFAVFQLIPLASTIYSVSYTHLDVYKRQLRSAPNAIFTSGVAEGNSICSLKALFYQYDSSL